MGNIIVLSALVLAVVLVIRSMVRSRKKGKSLSCGGDCKSCAGGCRHMK
ncbi:MAG: FeoB-associated Cys-rich membrane protein [Blautia sp.]|nr:FeoB-associated Cys-rich membrane protein [Blautia sp.]